MKYTRQMVILVKVKRALWAAAGCLILVFPNAASADLELQVNAATGGCSDTVNVDNKTAGPISVPFSICNGNISGTGDAAYPPAPGAPATLGQKFSFSGSSSWNTAATGNVQVSTFTAVTDPMLQLSGAPAGTPLDLQFFVSYGGTYNYSGLGYALLQPTAQIFLPNQHTFLLNNSTQATFCAVSSGCPYTTPQYNPAIGASGSGSINQSLTSTSVLLAAGTTQLAVNYEFQLLLIEGGPATASPTDVFTADFLDPFSLTNIEVTNANTGLPVSGITITGSSGAVYPVNVPSAVPEPSYLSLAGTFLIATGMMLRNRIVKASSEAGPKRM